MQTEDQPDWYFPTPDQTREGSRWAHPSLGYKWYSFNNLRQQGRQMKGLQQWYVCREGLYSPHEPGVPFSEERYHRGQNPWETQPHQWSNQGRSLSLRTGGWDSPPLPDPQAEWGVRGKMGEEVLVGGPHQLLPSQKHSGPSKDEYKSQQNQINQADQDNIFSSDN